MSFSREAGYVPAPFTTLMSEVKDGVNAQFGTSYTDDSFLGTGFYQVYYPIVQYLAQSDILTSEVFIKLQEYIAVTNEKISRPAVTANGLIDVFARAGYIASIKKNLTADAGTISIAVDVDSGASDYAARKLALCTLIRDNAAAGIVTTGTESQTLALSNGQTFAFKYNLPNRINAYLRLTVTLSNNNQYFIDTPVNVRLKLMANIASRYQLGRDFEPLRYFNQADAPWSSKVLLEWSTNAGSTWNSTVYNAAYNDLFTIQLANVTIVEN